MLDYIPLVAVLLFFAWYVGKALGEWDKLPTRVQVLERQVRALSLRQDEPGAWRELLELQDANERVGFCEEKLYDSEQKIFGRESSMAYWRKALADAESRKNRAYEELKEVRKKATEVSGKKR